MKYQIPPTGSPPVIKFEKVSSPKDKRFFHGENALTPGYLNSLEYEIFRNVPTSWVTPTPVIPVLRVINGNHLESTNGVFGLRLDIASQLSRWRSRKPNS